MSLWRRLNTAQSRLPQKKNSQAENVGVWLIENDNKDFIESTKQLWRLTVKSPKTESDRLEIEQLHNDMESLMEQFAGNTNMD